MAGTSRVTGGFRDHFSGHAADYAAYRPGYPAELYDWLAGLAPARRLAWDCATGSGQAALELAQRFERVFASDASEGQLRHARPAVNVEYRAEPAEQSRLADRSADLVTVAQAYHWLDHARFIAECGRVCRQGAVVAVWCYTLARVHPSVDRLVRRLYSGMVGPHWPPERRLVENGYRDLVFPWPEVESPAFTMAAMWTLAQFENYLRTWSAVQRFVAEKGQDPVEMMHADLNAAWSGDVRAVRRIEWPIRLRAFRIR